MIYLDYAATAPMRPEVLSAYTAALGVVGNPSSIHGAGQAARALLEDGRERIAASLGADAVEVVLTGGGTEAVNLGIKGLFWARNPAGRVAAGVSRPRLIVPRAEHHATIDSVEWLAAHEGAILDWIPVDSVGRIRLDALEAALVAGGDEVALVTALWANNEVGTLQPVAEIVSLAAAHGVPVHLDAIAAYGSVPIDFHASGAAVLSVSAHKIGGPVGIGALLVARNATVEPLLHGGNQQRARSGTQDAAGAAAFGVAAGLLAEERPPGGGDSALAEVHPRGGGESALAEERPQSGRDSKPNTSKPGPLKADPSTTGALRDRLVHGIQSTVPGATLRGDPDPARRLPGNAHFTFEGCEGDSLLFLLDVAGFAVSTGSACQAGVPEASHVLLAMGVSEADARGALRFTLGHDTTSAEIDALLAVLPGVVSQARGAGLVAREPSLGR